MNASMRRTLQLLIRSLGSLAMAVSLLIVIAAVLGWGTIYEARFGTAAVQRVVYHSWWFQALLAFLALNLAVAACERYPWQRRHVPFVLAHIGIILILLGGILGARFGIEGQMIIPEGQAEHTLETPGNVLVVRQPNPGVEHVVPTAFEAQAWVHEPNLAIPLTLEGRTVQLTVDRYYPDAVSNEEITDGGAQENPAVHVLLEHREQQDAVWLLSRDPERFGVGWGEAHVLFLEPKNDQMLDQLTARTPDEGHPRGVVSITLPGMAHLREIPVPEDLHRTFDLEGTPYRITFKDYFPDFAITARGLVSRSAQPNNPAVSFLLTGPEGSDAYLLFALHPDFQSIHGVAHTIPAEVGYTHAASAALPPNAIALLRAPSNALIAVLTGSGAERQVIDPVEIGKRYAHPSLGYQFDVEASYPRATVTQRITNRGNEVHTEAVHLIGREGNRMAEAWLSLRGTAQLDLGAEPIIVEYRPARRELPVTIKLLDFRKTDYPGTQMAAGFESDVELSDPTRGLILMRKISMNNPLRYRGYSFYQSSYIPGPPSALAGAGEGPTETTVLSVRNDPGTPLVYAGFIIVILGVVSMFVLRDPAAVAGTRPEGRPSEERRVS